MDFRRIEYILIVAFLCLNLFLGYVFIGKNSLLFADPSNQTAINVNQEMQSDDIVYDPPSSEKFELPLIRTRRHTLLDQQMANLNPAIQEVLIGNGQRLFGRFNQPIELPRLNENIHPANLTEDMLAPIQAILTNGTIIKGDQYQYQIYNPQQQMIRYVQKTAEGKPIVDDSSELVFLLDDDYNIISYEQTFAGEAEPQGKPRTLITEQMALENLYLNNRIPVRSTIIKKHLAYYTTLPLTDMTMYSPVWTFCIQTEDGGILTWNVDAISGAIIQNGGIPITGPETPSAAN